MIKVHRVKQLNINKTKVLLITLITEYQYDSIVNNHVILQNKVLAFTLCPSEMYKVLSLCLTTFNLYL